MAKEVVFQTVTEGSSQNRDKPDLYRPSDRLITAFRVAVDNLLAAQGFHDLIVGGAKQQVRPSVEPRYVLMRPQLVDGDVAHHIGVLRSSVATYIPPRVPGVRVGTQGGLNPFIPIRDALTQLGVEFR